MLEARADQQLVFHQHFQRQLRGRVNALVTDALIAAHRAAPQGPHADAMMRVLVYFGSLGRYALYAPRPLSRYWLVRLPAIAGTLPERVDAREYDDLGEARHALFLRHVEDLRREVGA